MHMKQQNGGTLAFLCGREIVLGDAEGFLTGRRTKALEAAPSSEAVAWISSSWCLSFQQFTSRKINTGGVNFGFSWE